MASSYSTDLKLELMVTGENSGTWGDKTNTNLNLLQQAIAGYQAVSIAGGAQTTALAMTDATISNARNAVIKLTGTITGNQIVTIPDGIEKTYIVENGTTGAFTVQFKTVTGTGPTFSTTDKGIKIVYSDGTNVTDINANLSASSFPQINDLNGNEEIKFTTTASAVNELTVANAATGNAPEISATGDDTNIDIKITPKGTGKVVLDGIKYPNTDGSAGQVLSTDGSGNLSFIAVSSEAQFIAGSLPLAANKSTTARTAVSISKTTGEVGNYPVLNVLSSVAPKTVTTTSTIDLSLDGQFGIITSQVNSTTMAFVGVYTPSNGTPVIGNTSVILSGSAITNQGSIASRVYKVDGDIFFATVFNRTVNDGIVTSTVRATTFRVNTSGAITVGNITSVVEGGVDYYSTQVNVTTYLANLNTARVLGLSTNLTTIYLQATNTAASTFAATSGNYFNFGNIGDTYYYPSGNSIISSTLNATTRLFSTALTSTNTAANFYNNTATWYKVSNFRWLADYQNATTLAQEIATFNVNATTLAFTSIQSTSRLYSGMFRFIGTTTDIVSVSTNLTTAVLDYAAGLGYNVNTLELSTNGEIKGYNVGTYLGVANANPYEFTLDPNISTNNQVIAYYVNTTNQYRNLVINAASTDQFNYAGVATANDTTSPVTIIQNGIQSGYTGLLIGTTYYAEFDGTLTTVATNITAGVAVTSTQLQIRQVNI